MRNGCKHFHLAKQPKLHNYCCLIGKYISYPKNDINLFLTASVTLGSCRRFHINMYINVSSLMMPKTFILHETKFQT